MNGQLILFLILDLLWICFIFSRSLKTAELSLMESGRILALVQKVLPFMTAFLIRKLGHFTEFLILGGLLFLSGSCWLKARGGNRRVFRFGLPLLAGLLTAVGDECIQLGVEGRSGELRDVLIDLGGVVCALLIGALLSGRKPKESPPPAEGKECA